jgi:hypothetical protein
MTQRQPKRCADCVNLRIHKGRGLCTACYDHHRRQGTLDALYPTSRPRRLNADVIEDYTILRGRGLIQAEIAEHMGMNLRALQAAIHRARTAGIQVTS